MPSFSEPCPQSGSTVKTQPAEVIFKFNQPVGGTVGAVRVYDAQGDQVDNLDVSHPDGNQSWMGVGLKPNLPDGTYTATYRVISPTPTSSTAAWFSTSAMPARPPSTRSRA